MEFFAKLGLADGEGINIDWELTPDDTFGTFESWGGRERLRSNQERFYYFFIDGWEKQPQLLFMERGIKHARLLARIEAPPEMLERCIAEQGKAVKDKNFAIDEHLRQWLLANVINGGDSSKVIPFPAPSSGPGSEQATESDLPGAAEPLPAGTKQRPVRHEPKVLSETELPGIITAANFFDRQHNPGGTYTGFLVDNGDGLTVSDLVSGVMWQRSGCDITTIRQVHGYYQALNKQRFAGYSDWRLPTLEEGLALLMPVRNEKGLHLHPCFDAAQPFIFLADERRPGGYWFIDFMQGNVFWASGTIPGGFGRVCRTL
jgi:hypothetical protein